MTTAALQAEALQRQLQVLTHSSDQGRTPHQSQLTHEHDSEQGYTAGSRLASVHVKGIWSCSNTCHL